MAREVVGPSVEVSDELLDRMARAMVEEITFALDMEILKAVFEEFEKEECTATKDGWELGPGWSTQS